MLPFSTSQSPFNVVQSCFVASLWPFNVFLSPPVALYRLPVIFQSLYLCHPFTAICRLLPPFCLLSTAPVSPFEPPHRHLQPPRRLKYIHRPLTSQMCKNNTILFAKQGVMYYQLFYKSIMLLKYHTNFNVKVSLTLNGVNNTNFAPFPLHNPLKNFDSGLNRLTKIQVMHLGEIMSPVLGVDWFRNGEG